MRVLVSKHLHRRLDCCCHTHTHNTHGLTRTHTHSPTHSHANSSRSRTLSHTRTRTLRLAHTRTHTGGWVLSESERCACACGCFSSFFFVRLFFFFLSVVVCRGLCARVRILGHSFETSVAWAEKLLSLFPVVCVDAADFGSRGAGRGRLWELARGIRRLPCRRVWPKWQRDLR